MDFFAPERIVSESDEGSIIRNNAGGAIFSTHPPPALDLVGWSDGPVKPRGDDLGNPGTDGCEYSSSRARLRDCQEAAIRISVYDLSWSSRIYPTQRRQETVVPQL